MQKIITVLLFTLINISYALAAEISTNCSSKVDCIIVKDICGDPTSINKKSTKEYQRQVFSGSKSVCLHIQENPLWKKKLHSDCIDSKCKVISAD